MFSAVLFTVAKTLFTRRSYSGVNVSEGGSREVATGGGEEQRHKGWTLSTKMQSDRKPEP